MRPTVLFVDDESYLTFAVTRALRKEPFDVVSAHSGAEALDVLRRQRVDLCVVDEKMPGMSGTELLQHVFRDYPHVIQMMLTGHATPEAVLSSTRPGQLCRFFTKPCTVQELAAAIRAALDRQPSSVASAASTARGPAEEKSTAHNIL